jgi:hypothetical protein
MLYQLHHRLQSSYSGGWGREEITQLDGNSTLHTPS